MAGNNLIKLLRCTSTTRANSTEILLNGQPLVEQDTHLMYVGDGVTEAKNLTPYGGGGAQLEDNCVLYSKVQSLTEEQKNQARINIGINITNIDDAVVTLGAALTYNGSEQTQTIQSVVLDGIPLIEGIDYIVINNKQTNAGTYTLSVIGKFPYSGSVQKTWTIAKAAAPVISLDKPSVQIVGEIGKTETVTVSSSVSGTVSVQSSEPNIVTATVSEMTVTLTGKANGSATVTITFNGGSNYEIATTSIGVVVLIAKPVLNDNSWEEIKYIADNDLGAAAWEIGDTKAITLNGFNTDYVSYDNVTVWVYIIGFNHNASVEGQHLIHFGCFKTAQTDGIDIALDDSIYGLNYGGKGYAMDEDWVGWEYTHMRTALGSNGSATPSSGTLRAAFPSDLIAVMQPATKYSDNSSSTEDDASNVTSSQEYLPLLAEFEVFGKNLYANSAEQNYQEQYEYFANGNSTKKYKQSSTSAACGYFLRSKYIKTSVYTVYYCGGDSEGSRLLYNYSYGVAPIFFV